MSQTHRVAESCRPTKRDVIKSACCSIALSCAATAALAGQVDYTYDALGRLDSVTYDDGTAVQYSYDSAGNRTSRVIESGSFSINDVSAQEGNNLTFTVTRSGPTSQTQNVSYATSNGSATAGSDYTAKSGTLSFTSGQSSKTVTITGIEDSVLESNETFYVNLSSATGGATISDSQGVGTITNDDAAPSFSINNVTAQEGNNLTFTVTKSGATTKTHNVNYSMSNGSAAAGSDYTISSGTLSFASSQTSRTITVASIEDSTFEPSEYFYVNLSAATNGATISDSQGVGTITNDDAAPAFSINNVTAQEGNNLTFTVTKSGSTSKTHNVNYATANGSATAGSDYTAKSGTLSFTSGQSSKTVTITGIEDSTPESNETFYVNLSSATAGATISDSQGRGTITNDDVANSPPNAQNDTVTVNGLYVDRTAFVLSNDSDPDGDTLTITNVTQPYNAQVNISGGGTRIAILSTSTGTSTFSYTVSDGNGGTDSAVVTLTVNGGGGGGGGPPIRER